MAAKRDRSMVNTSQEMHNRLRAMVRHLQQSGHPEYTLRSIVDRAFEAELTKLVKKHGKPASSAKKTALIPGRRVADV